MQSLCFDNRAKSYHILRDCYNQLIKVLILGPDNI